MLMMAADGGATACIHCDATHSFNHPSSIPYFQLSKPPSLHFTPDFNTHTHTFLPPHFYSPSACFTRNINAVALPPSYTLYTVLIKEVSVEKHVTQHAYNTAALSVNVSGWTPRTDGASLMHRSWFSHQLTHLFMPSCWETNSTHPHTYTVHNRRWMLKPRLYCLSVSCCPCTPAWIYLVVKTGGDTCYMFHLDCNLLSGQADTPPPPSHKHNHS